MGFATLRSSGKAGTIWFRVAGSGAVIGTLALGVYHLSGNLQIAGAASILGVAVITLIERVLAQRAQEREAIVIEAFVALARGDWSARLEEDNLGDLSPLAAAFNQLAESMHASTERVGTLTRELLDLPNQISGAISELDSGVDDQEAAAEETSSLLANINTSIRGINTEIVQLARSNEETASSIMEMGSAIEQVATSALAVRDGVDSSTSSVHELNAQISRVSESSNVVQETAEETAAAISEMDHAIREVGKHVRSAAELTEQVSESADQGANAVGATIEGIAQIRDLTQDAKTALEGLAERIGTIGDIASVINGISDETNLLSLNAAIIAAQAGEHGRAFAVVAEQVKTLAQRTTQSTQEIEDLIKSVQEQSEIAVHAMGAGIEAVEQGVKRSRIAGESLERIRESARDASLRVSEINRASDEQARNSKHVADSAMATSSQVQQIASALTEQNAATEQILTNSTKSLEMCHQMSGATEEQRSSSRYISENISSITDLIASIQGKTASHEQASQGVADSVIAMLNAVRKSSKQIPEVTQTVLAIRDRAEAVGQEIQRFDGEVSKT